MNRKFKRGFKTKAENIAKEARTQLNLNVNAFLPAKELAGHYSISVKIPEEIPGLSAESLSTLLQKDTRGWSAVTIGNGSQKLIIHNPSHSPKRQESNIMHELTHVLCEHSMCQIQNELSCPLPMRKFDEDQEAEAEWLGGCLQIPRDGLIWAMKRGFTPNEISEHFMASPEMVRYRMNKTGARYQVKNYKY